MTAKNIVAAPIRLFTAIAEIAQIDQMSSYFFLSSGPTVMALDLSWVFLLLLKMISLTKLTYCNIERMRKMQTKLRRKVTNVNFSYVLLSNVYLVSNMMFSVCYSNI